MWPSPWTAGADAWTTFSGLTPRHWRDDHCEVIERLWRSLKYEAVYLHDLTDCFLAKRVIGEWIDLYNTERPHSALAGRTPTEAYGAWRPVDMMEKARALPKTPQALQQQQ